MKEGVSVAEGYAHLAISIVKSGIKENDIAFLKSEWCDMLIDLIKVYYEMHPTDIQVYDLQYISKVICKLKDNKEDI